MRERFEKPDWYGKVFALVLIWQTYGIEIFGKRLMETNWGEKKEEKYSVVDSSPNIDAGMFDKVARISFPGSVSI